MPKKPGAERIYDAAARFREQCLERDNSLIWPAEIAWSAGTLGLIRQNFVDAPLLGEGTFEEKIRAQFATLPTECWRVLADALYFYALPSTFLKKSTKYEQIRDLVDQHVELPPIDAPLWQPFESGFSRTGQRYHLKFPQLRLIFLFAAHVKENGRGELLSRPAEVQRVLDDLLSTSVGIERASDMRDAILHLLFPDTYERIISTRDKRRIIQTYSSLLTTTDGDVDSQLREIRRSFEARPEYQSGFDFYQLQKEWRGDDAESETAEIRDRPIDAAVEKTAIAAESTRIWMEKTDVAGHEHRTGGPNALGRALWSPQASVDGKQIYRHMLDVRPGDIVLHLTDRAGITAASRVAAPADTAFVCPNDSKWAGRPGYRVELRDFTPLEPPLLRQHLLGDVRHKPTLLRLLNTFDNLFYDRELNLNQGKYLTEVPRELAELIAQIYSSTAGKEFPFPELRGPNFWMFQANTAYYDIRNALKNLPTQSWLVTAHRDRMRIGDRVFLWEAGSDGGVVGTGVIAAAPAVLRMPSAEQAFVTGGEKFDGDRMRVILRDLKPANPPLPRDAIRENEDLRQLAVLRQPQGTNYPVTRREAAAIIRLLEGGAVPVVTDFADLAARLYVPKEFLENVADLLRVKRQLIFYGPPGTGKTFVAAELARAITTRDRVHIVQFHPSYSYEDFVQGFRPVLNEGGAAVFDLRPGALLRAAEQARKSPEPVVLLIDELNRANVAKVMGELYFLLEYRGEAVTLQYSDRPFSLPENLLVIGTMNTADRSIALVDAALRRRFFFVPFFTDKEPISGVLRRYLGHRHPEFGWLADVVDHANSQLRDRNFAIGPSYFFAPTLSEAWLETVWRHAVLPYLSEFFIDAPERLDDFELNRLRSAVNHVE